MGVGDVQMDGALHRDMSWVAGATERFYADERLLMGGWQEEEGIQKDPETIETGGAGGARIKFLTVVTDPRYVAVTVRCWNTTTT